MEGDKIARGGEKLSDLRRLVRDAGFELVLGVGRPLNVSALEIPRWVVGEALSSKFWGELECASRGGLGISSRSLPVKSVQHFTLQQSGR
jgi:hypothetical protein